MIKNTVAITADPTEKRRSANSSSGSIGWRARRCHAIRAAAKTAATANPAKITGEPQPCSGPSMMAYTTAVTATMDRAAPAGSSGGVSGSRDRGSHTHTAAMTSATTGTL